VYWFFFPTTVLLYFFFPWREFLAERAARASKPVAPAVLPVMSSVAPATSLAPVPSAHP